MDIALEDDEEEEKGKRKGRGREEKELLNKLFPVFPSPTPL
ncbi:hypothetical protein PP707_02140 [Acetobacter pasteurianus]|nr:hypothetical protein [Acetobacter pasteurianus]